MTAWLIVIGAGIVTIAMKGAAAFTGHRTAAAVDRLQLGLAPSLLAALVVTQVASDDAATTATRLAGVGTAEVLLLLRVPGLIALGAAAAVAAAIRLL